MEYSFLKCKRIVGKKQRGEHNSLGVRAVQLRQFFSKFITELIGIGFFIIETNAHRLRSVFRPIVVWFFVIGLIGLKKKNYFFIYFNLKIGLSSPMYTTFQDMSTLKHVHL